MALPSIIRIIEHYQVGDVGPDVPDQMPHTVLQATAVITLIPGNARGRYGIRLRPYLPAGSNSTAKSCLSTSLPSNAFG